MLHSHMGIISTDASGEAGKIEEGLVVDDAAAKT